MTRRVTAYLLVVATITASAVMLSLEAAPSLSASLATASSAWSVRDVGMTALTHDTVCHQYDQSSMTRLVGYIPQLHANFASDDVPYDDASGFDCAPGPLSPADYLKAWADTIHAAGLHVLFRGNWNHWAGDYGQAKLSYSTNPAIPFESGGGLQAVLSGQDTSSYIGLTYQWILHHADVFQDGDIFEPFGEPQNNGIANGPAGTSAAHCPQNLCQFPSTAAFNQWLSDFGQADQAAFRTIGKNVASGWFGLAGNFYPYVTPSALSYTDTYNVDHFTTNFTTFTSDIRASYNAFGKRMVVEWGDFQDNGAEPATANTTDEFLGWLAQQPYVIGEEYWQLTGSGSNGPEAAVDFGTGQMTPAGQEVAKWFGVMANVATPTPTPVNTPVPPTAVPTSTLQPPTAVPTAARAAASRPQSPGHVTFVQGHTELAFGLKLQGAYAKPVRAGDLLVGVFRTEGKPWVHDSVGRNWVEAVQCGVVSIWYMANARSGATTVLLNSTIGGQLRMALAEYSGISRARPLDRTACGQGSDSAVRTGSTASVGSGEMAFAGLGSGTYPLGAIVGRIGGREAVLRALATGKPGTIVVEDVVATALGPQSASLHLSAGGGWSAAVAIFKRAT